MENRLRRYLNRKSIKIRVKSKYELWDVKNQIREENMDEEEDGNGRIGENEKCKYSLNVNEYITK